MAATKRSVPSNGCSLEMVRLLSHELHQVAQPLTILQGLLELSLLKAGTVDDYQKSVQAAMDQLQRAMQSFNHAREILTQAQPVPVAAAIEERKIQHV